MEKVSTRLVPINKNTNNSLFIAMNKLKYKISYMNHDVRFIISSKLMEMERINIKVIGVFFVIKNQVRSDIRMLSVDPDHWICSFMSFFYHDTLFSLINNLQLYHISKIINNECKRVILDQREKEYFGRS